jgi:hypothetical protein
VRDRDRDHDRDRSTRPDDGAGTDGGAEPEPDTDTDPEATAAYVLRARVRLPVEGVDATPDEFETTVRWPAAAPGEPGWLFFRDHCWRGEAADEAHLRTLLADRLDLFGGDDPDEVRHRYLGSSVHVTDADEV